MIVLEQPLAEDSSNIGIFKVDLPTLAISDLGLDDFHPP